MFQAFKKETEDFPIHDGNIDNFNVFNEQKKV
jgi:hypothetical protein